MRMINLAGKAVNLNSISSWEKTRDYAHWGIRVYFHDGDYITAWYNSERARNIDYNWLFDVV